MKIKHLLVLFMPVGLLLSCTNDNTETLMEKPNTTELITYNLHVKSIINNNCISCHAATPINGASTSLTTYEQVKNSIANRGLLNRISLSNGSSSLMPKGGPRLPQETINIVTKWEQDGLLE